jgi:hypothetical protein
MAVSEQLKALVDQLPDPDGRGMLTENVDKDKIEKTIAVLAQGGADSVRGLVEMLGEPGSDQDAKPHYALHCLANYTLVTDDEKARKQLCEVLAAELGGDGTDYVKSFLCQTLQWAGRRESVSALGQLLTDQALCDPAAMALVAIKDGAAEQLRAALPKASGACRLAVIHSLAALADAGSATALKEAVKDADREVRIAGGAGLAKLGDASAVDLLIGAADAEPGWERIQAAKNCMVLAENLLANGKKSDAEKIYRYLHETRTDPSEGYIRDAAAEALAQA